MHKNTPVIIAISGSTLLLIATIGIWYLFPKIVDLAIHSNIDLKEGTQGYSFWKVQPFPMKFKIYFWNVTNANDVQFGAKPILKEIGPFVYDEFREREQISINEKADTLRYMLKKYYHYNQTDSGANKPDDVVTILNAAIVGTALQVELMLPTAVSMVSEAIPYLYPGAKDIFLTAKAKDILFDGIKIHCTDEAVEFICGAMKTMLPKTIRIDENGKDFIFSMFGHLNGTDDGPWEMERGFTKNTSRGEIYKWEEKAVLDIWGDQYCNMINGSDSTVFNPISEKNVPKLIYSFAHDFCRSLYITYEGETKAFGLKAYRYATTEDSLSRIPQNDCFCPLKLDDEEEEFLDCPPSGLADITPCMKAPILISYPHFYLADPKLFDYVTGLNPNKELHENFAVIEPLTATPLIGRKRVQLNIQVKPLEGFELLENVTEGIFPIIWIEEGATLPDDIAHFIVSNLSKITYLTVFKWFLILAGLGMITTGVVLILKREQLLCFGSGSNTKPVTNIAKPAPQSARVDDSHKSVAPVSVNAPAPVAPRNWNPPSTNTNGNANGNNAWHIT